MVLQRKICFCLQPLKPKQFISRALRVLLSISLVGLVAFMLKLAVFRAQSRLESVYFALSMLANLVLNTITVFAIVSFEHSKWSTIRRCTFVILSLKLLRLAAYCVQSVAEVHHNLSQIRSTDSKDIVLGGISNIVVEIISCFFGGVILLWMIFLCLGILKMTHFMAQAQDEDFKFIQKNFRNKDKDDLNTQIISISSKEKFRGAHF